jgi:hypothetical protein
MAAPFLPATKAPTPAPPAMIAAVRALRPNFDLCLVCPSAETSVPVTTSKLNTRIKTSNLFITDLLDSLGLCLLTFGLQTEHWQTLFLSVESQKLFREEAETGRNVDDRLTCA